MQIVECFKILNVSPGEDWRKVRKSYHSLAKQFHPDINPEKRSDDTRLKEINQAFEYLETHYKAAHNVLPDQRGAFTPKRNPDIWGSLFDSLRDNSAVQRVFDGKHFSWWILGPILVTGKFEIKNYPIGIIRLLCRLKPHVGAKDF